MICLYRMCSSLKKCINQPEDIFSLSGYSRSYWIILPSSLMGIIAGISICYKCTRKKAAPQPNQGSANLSYIITEDEFQSYPPETDLPPIYDAIVESDYIATNDSRGDAPDLIATISLYSKDGSDELPTYDEAYAPMADSKIPPPTYETVA